MPRLSKIGKAGFGAARRARRFRAAAREAEARGATAAAEPFPLDIDTRLTPGQAALLIRFTAGKLVQGRLEILFLPKYLLLLAGIPLLFVFPPLGIGLLVLFALACLLQWCVYRVVGRLAAFHRLGEAEEELTDAATVWWPNLKREMARVGLPTRPWPLLKLAAARAAHRLDPAREAALAAVDWREVMPRDQWRRARQVLAREAGATPRD